MAKKTPSDTYPIKLTQLQRESVLRCTDLTTTLKRKLRNAGKGTQVVDVTRGELDRLEEEVSYAASYVRHPHKGRLVAVLRKVDDLIFRDYEALFNQEASRLGETTPNHGGSLYQFKITLRSIKPPIWRRIQIPDCTLANLHEYIQGAFGWDDDHMHKFVLTSEYYGPPPSDEFGVDEDMLGEAEVRISSLIPASCRRSRWIYEYDFGDGWQHEIVFEGFPPTRSEVEYPICVEGKRACPPEDCGGPWDYADYVNAISDPKHNRHEELLEWGGPFDPEAFDAEEATKAMRGVEGDFSNGTDDWSD